MMGMFRAMLPACLFALLIIHPCFSGQALAKKPSTLGLTPGYLIIGSYLIHKDALTEENYQAAMGTVTDPAAGLYYKSEFADGAWVRIEQAIGLADLTSMNVSHLVSEGSIDQLKLTLWIDQNGQITSLQTEEELLRDMAKLEEEKQRVEEEQEIATAQGDLVQSVELSLQAEELSAQMKLLQAVLANDQNQALAEMKKINNRAGLLDEMTADTLPTEAGENEQELGEEVEPSEEQDPERQEEEAEQADQDEALEIPAQLQDLVEAIKQVEMGLEEARQIGDQALILGLEATLAQLTEQMRNRQKVLVWDEIEALMDRLEPLDPTDPSADELLDEIADRLAALSRLEKEWYTEEELAELERLGRELEKRIPDSLALPVEQVISIDFPVKFDVPPILMNERVFIQLRPISESFGALVVWDPVEKSVTISKDGTLIVCYINQLTAYINGQPTQLDVPPQLMEGRTMVPLRFVMEGLGLDIEWISDSKHIIIKQG